MEELYIARIEDGMVYNLSPYGGTIYQDSKALIATLDEIKIICLAMGWSYENYTAELDKEVL